MKKLAVSLLLMYAPLLLASKPDPSQYQITVHVQCSYWRPQGNINQERIGVLLDGKPVELSSSEAKYAEVLPLGNYKARLVEGHGPNPLPDSYELLLPNGKTRTFYISGLAAQVCAASPQ